jgi:phosphonate transport system permease protein
MTDTASARSGDIRADYLAHARQRQMYSGILLLVFTLLMVSGFQLADARNAGGFWTGIHQFFDFPSEVVSEAIAKAGNLPGLMWTFLPSLIETINIAGVATLIGACGGALLSLLSTRGLARFPALIPVFRRLMDAMRAIPEIVIALVLIFLLGGGPVPAVIAISLHTAGALGKLFSEVAENADLKPVEGLASVGAGWGQQVGLGVLPQVAPNWLSYALMRFEINLRASAILGFVGAGGIGYDLKLAMQWGMGRYDEVVAIFALLFVAIVAIDRLSDHARSRLVRG